ncbi:retrovirus-related pol polyprotein from transposon TNT 1-94 [Tanacetum coccineum]
MDYSKNKDVGVNNVGKPLKMILQKTSSYTPPGVYVHVGSGSQASNGSKTGGKNLRQEDVSQGSNDKECGAGNDDVNHSSFASTLKSDHGSKNLKFRSLVNTERVDNHDVVLPKSAIDSVKHIYENSLVGFFVGKGVAFHLVQNYVMNTWSKFGLEKLMKTDDGVFLFKFGLKAGLEQVIERGPWMIRNSPLILSKWTPYVSLAKNQVSMAIPVEDRDGYTREVISVEYDWKPPLCKDCQIFRHTCETCPKRAEKTKPCDTPTKDYKDGFTKFKSRKKKSGKTSSYANPFDVLRTIDVEDKRADSNENVAASSSTNTPISKGVKEKSSIGNGKKNLVFSPHTKVHYYVVDDMDQVAENSDNGKG